MQYSSYSKNTYSSSSTSGVPDYNFTQQSSSYQPGIPMMTNMPSSPHAARTSNYQATNPIYQPSASSFQSAEKTMTSQTFADKEMARNVAKRIMDMYDRDRNGIIDTIEAGAMIVDTYKSFNATYSPSTGDIESYVKVMDTNGDGRVNLQDLETLCAKYLADKFAL